MDQEKQQQRWPLPFGLQIETLADLGVLICAVATLAGVLYLPQLAGRQLPDFRPLDAQERKEEFFDFLDPIVAEVSAEIAEQRAFLQRVTLEIDAGQDLSWLTQKRLDDLADYYEVETEDADLETDILPTLRRRIGIVPRSLVLIQAAKESGWGTSRFAVFGNNLFGQRCYSEACGIEPAGVGPNANFNIATFGSVDDAIASYMRNINTHPQYDGFRRLRQQLRREGKDLNGLVLADGLRDYSERGEAYVDEIKAMIAQNALESND